MSEAQETVRPWRVSLHGGHSGEYCDHAEGTLREMLEAAARAGYHTFGVSEHVPRGEERFLYPNERERGWDVGKTEADFEGYASAIPALAAEFADRLTVLRGFEAEVVPTASYVERMRGYRARTLPNGEPLFDYCVGSVHYVEELQIDGEPEEWRRAAEALGGPEALAVRYYATVAAMVEALRPEVVGHLDLIKKNIVRAGYKRELLEGAPVQKAAREALESVRAYGAILDLNTAGWRKGLGEPYPAPWLVVLAQEREIPFCFGDDSHRPSQVGEGLAAGREYLLGLGVSTVTCLTKQGERRRCSL